MRCFVASLVVPAVLYEAAYAKALVRLLDLRSKGSIECQPKRSTAP
jgi:hypothetical protein